MRELIIHVLAKCRITKPFRLVFEEDEVIKIKQLLYHFFKVPFSRYGEIGTINNFIEFWLLADFRESTVPPLFSVVPLLKGKGSNIQTVAELTINCSYPLSMIGRANLLLADRPNATKEAKDVYMKFVRRQLRQEKKFPSS